MIYFFCSNLRDVSMIDFVFFVKFQKSWKKITNNNSCTEIVLLLQLIIVAKAHNRRWSSRFCWIASETCECVVGVYMKSVNFTQCSRLQWNKIVISFYLVCNWSMSIENCFHVHCSPVQLLNFKSFVSFYPQAFYNSDHISSPSHEKCAI